jgi:hypothetical protein
VGVLDKASCMSRCSGARSDQGSNPQVRILVAHTNAVAPSGSDYVASTDSTNCYSQGKPFAAMRWTHLGSLNYGSLAGDWLRGCDT